MLRPGKWWRLIATGVSYGILLCQKAQFVLKEIARAQTFMDRGALRDYYTTFARLLLDPWATVAFRLSYGNKPKSRLFAPISGRMVISEALILSKRSDRRGFRNSALLEASGGALLMSQAKYTAKMSEVFCRCLSPSLDNAYFRESEGPLLAERRGFFALGEWCRCPESRPRCGLHCLCASPVR